MSHREARAVLERWAGVLMARQLAGDYEGALLGLCETYFRVQRLAEADSPETRDVLQPALDAIGELALELYRAWRQRRGHDGKR